MRAWCGLLVLVLLLLLPWRREGSRVQAGRAWTGSWPAPAPGSPSPSPLRDAALLVAPSPPANHCARCLLFYS